MDKYYYKFTDKTFYIKPVYHYFLHFAKKYKTHKTSDAINIDIANLDISKWKQDHRQDDLYPNYYIETLVILKKITDQLINYNSLLIHGSSFYIDNLNNAFIICAPSGVGKSTHVKLLKTLLNKRLNYINDDKPFIKLDNNIFYLYGSPWNGKERISNVVKAKLKAIFFISRNNDNKITKLSTKESFELLFRQIHLPEGEKQTSLGIDIIMKLANDIDCYHLQCNMSEEAPLISFNTIKNYLE